MAMLAMLYINTMLKVKQNNRVMKVANMVDYVRKQKQKVISRLKSLFWKIKCFQIYFKAAV